MATFGAGKENRVCETIKVAMKMKHGSDQEFEMLVVPQICEPISPQPLSICVENCEHLSQLELADPGSDHPLEVDVLIGSDYYWELSTGEVKRGATVVKWLSVNFLQYRYEVDKSTKFCMSLP